MKDAYDVGCRQYFAYGSDLNPDQMTSRCHDPKVLAVARLRDHALGFFGHSKKWDGGEETLIRRPGEDLWGVVYELSFSDAEHLDSWQDVRLDGTGPYFHFPIEVTDSQGMAYSVLLYKKDDLSAPGPPSRECLDYIIAGTQLRGLPPTYLDQLRKIRSVAATFSVPKKSRFDRSILFDRCTGCGDQEESESSALATGNVNIPRPFFTAPR
jgi:hypothetical protein